MSVLQTIDLKKYYGTEPNITRCLLYTSLSRRVPVSLCVRESCGCQEQLPEIQNTPVSLTEPVSYTHLIEGTA